MTQTNILLESGTNELEIVEFHLDEEGPDGKAYQGYYGVNVAKVLEIIRKPKVTEMPEVSHSAVLGAFNLRSHIIPLVDLSQWLGKKRVELEPPKVIVTEFNNVTTAFMVSGVNRIHRISWEDVISPNAYMSAFSGNSITGVVKIENRIIFLLDLEKIVADLNPALGLRYEHDDSFNENVGLKALVVDDSSLIRQMLKNLLEKANFSVTTLTNGRECWEHLVEVKERAEKEKRPLTDWHHVIVTDIEMPVMDGHNLTKRIKEDPSLKRFPVILFSSLINDKLRHKGDAVGADDQITKPEVTRLAARSKELIKQYWG